MADDKTCKFFAPDKYNAAESHLVANPRWRFDQLLEASSCTSPDMGAGALPVNCQHIGDHTQCVYYQPEPTVIKEAWRHENPAHAAVEGAFQTLVITEDRVGGGVRRITATRYVSNDPEGEQLVGPPVTLEVFDSSVLGDNLDENWTDWSIAYRQATGNDWERLTNLESGKHESYFGHVFALTE